MLCPGVQHWLVILTEEGGKWYQSSTEVKEDEDGENSAM